VRATWVPFRAAYVAETGKFWRGIFSLQPDTPLRRDAKQVLADNKLLFLPALAALICLVGDRLY